MASQDDETVRPFSASQIKTFALCPRKWGWKYIEGLEEPTKPAAEFGKRVHSVLERWLKGGAPPDPRTKEGKVAKPGLPFLPGPSDDLEVERAFRFRLGHHIYRGFVDLGYVGLPDPACPGCQGAEEGYECPQHPPDLPWVVDHKTTGDFAWALTEDDLLHDVQAIIYAKEALDRYDVDEVMLRWVYYRTRGKAVSQHATARMTRKLADSGFRVIEEYADEMSRLRELKLPVLDMDYNGNACGAYGGCHFQKLCGLSARERMRSIMAQNEKREALRAKMMARMEAKKKGKKPEDSGPSPEPEVNGDEPAANDRQLRVQPLSVNPPEKPDEETATSGLSDEEKQEATDKSKKKTSKKKASKKTSSKKTTSKKTSSKKTSSTPSSSSADKDGDQLPTFAPSMPEEVFTRLFVAGIQARDLDGAKEAWGLYTETFQ